MNGPLMPVPEGLDAKDLERTRLALSLVLAVQRGDVKGLQLLTEDVPHVDLLLGFAGIVMGFADFVGLQEGAQCRAVMQGWLGAIMEAEARL